MTAPAELAFEAWLDPEQRKEWAAAIRRLSKDAWYRVTGLPLQADVHVRVAVGSDGRLVCSGLMVGALDSAEVTSRDLRTVNLGAVMSMFAAFVSGAGAASELEAAVARHYGQEWIAERAARHDRPARVAGRAGLPDDHLERVAALYREGLQVAPQRPVAYFLEQWSGVPESTARRWIGLARRRGFLGSTSKGKAGEAPAATTRRRTK